MIFDASRVRVLVPVRCLIAVALSAVLAVFVGCGKPFNVKAKTDLPPARYAARTAGGDMEIQAQAVTDEDFLYERFDANLISAGVLPVRVMLKNSSDHPIDLKD